MKSMQNQAMFLVVVDGGPGRPEICSPVFVSAQAAHSTEHVWVWVLRHSCRLGAGCWWVLGAQHPGGEGCWVLSTQPHLGAGEC